MPSQRPQIENFKYSRNAKLNATDFSVGISRHTGLTPMINTLTSGKGRNYKARKLSPLVILSPTTIDHADYRGYAQTTGVITKEAKMLVLEKIEST